MSDAIERGGLRAKFWENIPMAKMTNAEWEALCDGCGKCCLNKLEDEDTGEVALTRVACRLLDDQSCLCTHYENRHQFVPDCIVLKPDEIESHMYWLPQTCAYRLIYQGNPLPDWHPLISGSAASVHAAGISVQHTTVSEFDTPFEEWEEHIIEE